MAIALASAGRAPAQNPHDFFGEAGSRVRTLETRFEAYWTPHIENSRKRILAAVGRVAGRDRAVVLGAGKCREIPLEELAEQFNEVVLVDLDRGSLDQATNPLPGPLASKIEFQIADVTSFALPMMEQTREAVQKSGTPGDAFDALAGIYRAATEPKALPSLPGADLVISSLVVSELHRYPRTYADRLLQEKFRVRLREWNQSEDLQRRLQQFAIDEHLQLLASLVRAGGAVYLSDTIARGPLPDRRGPELMRDFAEEFVRDLARLGVFETILTRNAATRAFAGALQAVRGGREPPADLKEARKLAGKLLWSPDALGAAETAATAVVQMLCLDHFSTQTEIAILEKLLGLLERDDPSAFETLVPPPLLEKVWQAQGLQLNDQPADWWWLEYPCSIPRTWGAFKVRSWILTPPGSRGDR